MRCNLGTTERMLRGILGVGLVTIGYVADIPQWAAVTAYVVGVVAVGTAAVGFCPAWKLAGINTCGRTAQTEHH